MQKVTVKDFKAKFSEYHRRMKEGEVFEVNGCVIGDINFKLPPISDEALEVCTIKKDKSKVLKAFTFTPMPKSKSCK